MPEQRKSPRIPVHVSARYRAGTVVLHGWTENLSAEGMFLALPEARPLFDDPLDVIEVDIADGAVTAKGEIRWIDGAHPGVGISFTWVSDVLKLAELIAAQP